MSERAKLTIWVFNETRRYRPNAKYEKRIDVEGSAQSINDLRNLLIEKGDPIPAMSMSMVTSLT